MATQDNYSEDDLYDQNPNDSGEAPDKDETDKEPAGEPFLAPKASFKGDLSPGTVHRVRIEAAHDSELELVCLGEEKSEEENEPQPAAAADESASLYE